MIEKEASLLQSDLANILRRYPSTLLLLMQLIEVVLYPATANIAIGRALLSLAGALVLLTALRLIRYIAAHVWLAAILAGLAMAFEVAWLALGWPSLKSFQAGLEALFYFYTAYALIRYILRDNRPTKDELVAAAATFTLLVWAFTNLLVLCQLLQPSAFLNAGEAGNPRSWSELMFLSFALFTNTGIGTVVPLTAASRAIGDLEMFAGVMYLALVVSRLVGQTAAQGVKD
jgi:hypothetical protein